MVIKEEYLNNNRRVRVEDVGRYYRISVEQYVSADEWRYKWEIGKDGWRAIEATTCEDRAEALKAAAEYIRKERKDERIYE